MKKDEAEALLGHDDLGPIEMYVEALAVPGETPASALGVCALRIEESAPLLRRSLAKAADGHGVPDDEWLLFFRGLYVLAGARDQASFQPLLRLLRLPTHDVDDLLGDAITVNLGQIIAGVFDDDIGALFAAATDLSIDGTVRGALLGAAAFLTWDGRIDRDRMHGLLRRIGEERATPDDDFAWYSWQEAIALLGFRDLTPLVEAAFADKRLSIFLKHRDFVADLVAAERAPTDRGRFERAGLGYVEDISDAMSWMDSSTDIPDGVETDPSELGYAPLPEPVRNPFRGIGRNDPCPCRSGKKAKKCCLASK